jgi:flagellar FliL protein
VEVPEAILAQIPDGRKTRMVQVRVTLVVRSPEAEDMVKKHMPLIRNNLLEFLTRTGAKALRTPEGREAMKQGALEEVQKLMKEQSGQTLVDRVLFPSFVMQ